MGDVRAGHMPRTLDILISHSEEPDPVAAPRSIEGCLRLGTRLGFKVEDDISLQEDVGSAC